MLIITYGVGNSVTKPEDSYRSIGQILNDTSIQTVLNFDPAQVDARVNGQIVEPGTGISANMRIDLIKKAGRKSNDLMNSDQQLHPLPVLTETLRLVASTGNAALQPIYDAFSKAENDIRAEVAKAQRELLKGCKPFADYVDAIIESIVTREFMDTDLKIPGNVREELNAVICAADEKLQPMRKAVADNEAAVSTWIRSVEADLKMCLTLPEQRAVLANALNSDPLLPWVFTAIVK